MSDGGAIVIYTDGACSGNPGPGGWGARLEYGKRIKELKGGALDTTNNRMELMAAISALAALKRPSRVVLFTDSRYIKGGITEWMRRWKENGWRTSAKKPVKNQDLWQQLDAVVSRHEIDWRWVKGHAGNPGNERADQLARAGMARVREESDPPKS